MLLCHPKVRIPDMAISYQLGRVSLHGNLAGLKYVRALSKLQCQTGILLHKDDGGAFVSEPPDVGRDLSHDKWCQTK